MSAPIEAVIYHDAPDRRYWWRSFKTTGGAVTTNWWTADLDGAGVFDSKSYARSKIAAVKRLEPTPERRFIGIAAVGVSRKATK